LTEAPKKYSKKRKILFFKEFAVAKKVNVCFCILNVKTSKYEEKPPNKQQSINKESKRKQDWSKFTRKQQKQNTKNTVSTFKLKPVSQWEQINVPENNNILGVKPHIAPL
jgi:hypothetical protein